MNETSSVRRFASNTQENRGRYLLLLLLFIAAIYQLVSMGLGGLMIVCLLPLAVVFVYLAFKYKMFTFWLLFVINYFVMFLNRYQYMPLPSSIPNEMLEILLLCIAIIDAKMFLEAKIANVMLIALLIWCGFCCVEVFNDTCDLGINIGAWYMGARLMAFQLLYAFLVCSIYISTPQLLRQFLKMWAWLSIIAVAWAFSQKYIGFTQTERMWLLYAGRTHLVNGITRYFSVFSDAANFGCNMAGSAVCFFVVSITSRIKKDKLFYLIAGIICTWGMFSSGTRTALFCMIAGFGIYIVLSKSFKIGAGTAVVFGLFISLLAFTTIGNGNDMIRRMRSGFNRNDASANVRDLNKAAIRKYIQDAPWGIGIGMGYENVPANNKFRKLSTIPPDSEYVFIWVHTGYVGISIFLLTTMMMFVGACFVVFFQLKSKSLQGIGGGLCAAFTAIQLGGYGNQILMQFPNVLIFYGGLALVYTLPFIEKAFVEEEEQRYALQEEKNRIKEEKRRASRV